MEKLPFSEWGYREYKRALTAMVVPAQTHALPALRDAFGGILLDHPIFPLNRARSGLTMALQQFRTMRPDALEVIVPAYICPSVIEAVEAAGLRALPVDVGADLNLDIGALEQSLGAETLAVVAVHMYGCPAAIREIEGLCRQRGVFLIDDSAQVTGISVGGQPLGTFGDFGIISFSQSKTIVAGCRNAGGLLIVNDSKLEAPIMAAYEALPSAQGYASDLALFLWNYILARWTEVPAYYFGRLFGRGAEAQQGARVDATRMNNLVAALALEQFKSLQPRIAGRRRVAELYQRHVASQQAVGFPQFAPGRYLTRIVLSVPRGLDVAKIRSALRHKGVRTRKGYPVYGGELVRRPERALALQPRLIELPSHSGMSADAVKRIWDTFAATVKDA